MFAKGLSDSARKRVDLAVAVAQEKLLSAHVDHALDLIALVNEDVGFIDALEIYTRLLRLEEDQAQNITTRTLAILGEKADQGHEWPAVEDPPARQPEPDDEDGEPGGRSLFGNLRLRLRGRVNEDLRRRIEFIAARTEVALIHTHVKNALHFVDFLQKEMDDRASVQLYLDALDVRESIAEVVYYLTLARLADDVLPPHGSGFDDVREPRSIASHEEAAGGLHPAE